ncbi:zinc finger protein 862-like [Dreissena polymorpha]|uniref:zinc finger protein 862-like n=1 Tax=Dreissena polymorpha TaxID=45954 RepID=UPI0022652B15|nr:zinc finger protein 862-like [Dreissena polymorpha]
MKCQWCANDGKTNVFATTGSNNYQKSALTRHEVHVDHVMVVNGRMAKAKKQTVQHIIEEHTEKVDSVNCESKTAQFRTLFFVANNGLPLDAHHGLIELQRINGCPDLQDKSAIYTGSGTQDEMLDYIDQHVQLAVLEDVKFSDFVGIIIDETTDITIHKKLNVYFKRFKAGTCEPVIHFMDCVSIVDGKAETIVSELVKLCKNIGLDMGTVISMASDGAAVMAGRLNGVGVKLRQQCNPRLVQIHCVAHRLALCAGQACRDEDSFNEYSMTVQNVYKFYHNSAIRYNQLREMETVMNGDQDTRHVTLKEPASFWWLSLQYAVRAIMDVYPALVTTLESQAASGTAEAKGILLKVRQASFLLRTAFLLDVFEVVNTLCRAFQKDELDIEIVNVSVQSTVDTN